MVFHCLCDKSCFKNVLSKLEFAPLCLVYVKFQLRYRHRCWLSCCYTEGQPGFVLLNFSKANWSGAMWDVCFNVLSGLQLESLVISCQIFGEVLQFWYSYSFQRLDFKELLNPWFSLEPFLWTWLDGGSPNVLWKLEMVTPLYSPLP